ncbi:MAG TPA: hypothetical protein VFV64_08160 [Permianibacter sp.]|nr:hypothetical protein [Permianibacter sp.]
MNRSSRMIWMSGVASAVVAVTTLSLLPPTTLDCSDTLRAEDIAAARDLSLPMVEALQTKRSLSLADLCRIPDDKLARAIARVHSPKPDRPGEAISFRALSLKDENGHIADNGLAAAHAFVQQLKTRRQPTAGLSRAQWQWQGPGNIGGRVRAVLVHPDNPQKIWAGSVSGGIWFTEDGGANWAPVDDFMANLAVSTMVFDPNNPSVMYAGTGEGFFNADAIRGAGVFKSTDGGVTWNQLGSTAGSTFHYVNRLAFSANGQTLIAATNDGLFRSLNGGNTWSNVTPRTIANADRFLDLDFHPTDSNRVIASDDDIGVVYSTDGGQNWTAATGFADPQRIELAYAPSNPSIVYASAERNNGEIWKSTNGGQTFTVITVDGSGSDQNHLGEQGWYDNAIWVDPSNANRLVVGGIDLFRSTDGGVTLEKFSTWWQSPLSAHADQHTIVSHPQFNGTDNFTVFVGNDGGVYRIDNVFTALDDSGFTELNNNLGITQFYSVAAAPDGKLAGGTQDNGHLVKQGDSESWVDTYGGDGGFAAIDPTNSNYVYGEYVYLEIHRSTDGGSEWSASQIASSDMTSDGANFIAPFILDPNNPNTMLAGAEQLWRSTNVKAATPSWTSIKPSVGSPISAIAVAPGNSDIVWVGHNNGALYVSINATAPVPTWSQVGDAALPSRYLTRIAIDPSDNNIAYVAFGGFSSNNLYKTLDGGANWESISDGLPAAPIRTIAIKPDRSQWLFVGTEVGVFASENAGGDWGLSHDGPANVSVDELVWMDNDTLVAGSHGRGIYTANIIEDSTPNAISFTEQTAAPLNTTLQSNTATIQGITVDTALTITGGQYSLGCNGSFSSSATTVRAGDTLCLRHTSASGYDSATVTTVTIGGSAFEFRSVTKSDNDPNAFSFASQTGVAQNTTIVSAPATITGIAVPAAVSIVGGQYSVGCTGTFTAAAGTISDGQTLCLRHTSANAASSTVTTTVTVGGGSATFQSTTAAASSSGGGGGGGGGSGLYLLPLSVLLLWRRRQR